MAADRKKNIRMIALDLDDTTLRTDKSMAPRTREALAGAAGQGIIVVVSTGRVLNSLPDNVKSVPGIRFAINSNGACINDLETGERLYENFLDSEKVVQIADLLAQYDFPVEVFTGGEAYMNESDYNRIKKNPSKYRSAEYILWSRRPVPDILV
jgi:hydroxymethylpyrimidine pyrophosphatase-like HAD family hydrolase